MKYCILLAVLAGLAVGQKEYDFETFKSEIDAKCLAKLWTNRDGSKEVHPWGNTLASFISMVEKVEGNNTGWSIYDVSKALLKRFAFEGIEYNENPGRLPVQSKEATIRWTIAKELVGEVSSSVSFEENNLSDNEKCSMFFMMGHLVNNTFRDGFDNPDEVNEAPAEKLNGDGTVQRTGVLKTVKQPREQGVISVHGSKNQAIAIAVVLNAILASKNDIEQDAEHVYNIPPTSQPIKIKPLIAITLGEVLTRAARRGNNNEGADRFFGPGGDWNSTLCPTEYILNKNVLGVTNALLRGAIDGMLIGQALKDGTSDYPGARLSRVLRMYYSRKGLTKQDNKQQGYSYCRREDVIEVMGGLGGNDAVLAYYKLFSYLSDRQFPNDLANNYINNAITQMNAAISTLHSGTGTEECKISREPSPDQPTCETPSNVFVVLDNSERGTSGFDEQENVVGMLTNRIDFGEGSGSLSVFQSALAGAKRLKEVALNASNPTCATCKTAWLQQTQLSKPDSEFQLMEALNDTLREFESKTGLLPGVPSRVVVLFHYDTPKDDKSTMQKAGNMLRDGHRDTRIFAVGSRDGLGPLVNGETNVITGNTDDDAIVKDLSSRICKVPAIFQYNKCYDQKSSSKNEAQNVYTGYVTDNHVQFWAFYPEYFLKSYNIKIKFRVETGDITVCEQRGVENPGYTNGILKKERCKKTDATTRELTFSFSNPCETYNVNNCPTINFAIIGEGKESRIAGCAADDKKCRRLDQIKFQMSHDGISCNGCEFLKSSPVVLAVIFLLSIINYKV